MVDNLTKVTEDSVRGGFFLFSGGVFSSVIMAISAMLLGRLLGSEIYGQYSIILVIPSLLVLLTDMGMIAGITKFTAGFRARGENERVPTIIRHAIIFRLIIGVLVCVLSILFADSLAWIVNRPDSSFYIRIASASILLQVMYNSSNAAFVGLDKSEYIAISESAQAVVKTVLQIGLVLLGMGLIGALIGYIGGFLVGSVYATSILFSKFLKTQNTIEYTCINQSFKQSLKLLASYSIPVYVAVILTGLLPIYQQAVLVFFASDAAIGNFKAAFNFITLLTILTTAIASALLPAFSKLESTHQQVIAFFKRVNKYTTLLIVPLTTLVILFSDQLIQLIYGPDYDSAALYLKLSVIIYYFTIIGYLSLISVFKGIGKTGFALRVTLLNIVVLIVLSPILGSQFGVVGVIIASLVAGIIAACYSAFIAARQLKLQFDIKSASRVLAVSWLASIAPLCMTFLTSLPSILLLVFGSMLYIFTFFTLTPLFGIVTLTEINELERLTGRIRLLGIIAKPVLKYLKKILNLV